MCTDWSIHRPVLKKQGIELLKRIEWEQIESNDVRFCKDDSIITYNFTFSSMSSSKILRFRIIFIIIIINISLFSDALWSTFHKM
jgi:hypothetical protein